MCSRLSMTNMLKNEKGAAAVEFALLLPLLVLILMGILVFGLVLNNYLEITHAAREGVRWASLRASFAEVEAKAKTAAPGIDWTQATLTISGVPDPPTEADQGNPVTVTVTYDIGAITALYGPIQSLFPSTIITSAATQRVE